MLPLAEAPNAPLVSRPGDAVWITFIDRCQWPILEFRLIGPDRIYETDLGFT